MSLAEMANTADYSAMTYNGLLELNVALNWGLMSVKSNLEPKRLEEMSNITHAYVVAMNGYGATKAEIMSCLEKEEMRENPMFSDIHDDVDDQSSMIEVKDVPDPHLLPEHTASSSEMDSKESCSSDETWSTLLDDEGNALSAKEVALVKMAVESAEELPAGEGTDSRMAYYVTYKFKYANGALNLIGGPSGWNMQIEDLDKLKVVEPMRNREHYKSVKVVYHGDYVVYLMAAGIVIVSEYSKDNEYVPNTDLAILPKELKEKIELAKAVKEVVDELEITTDESAMENESKATSGPNKEEALITNAVEKVKSMSIGKVVDDKAPYFTKCEFSIGDNNELVEGRPFARNIDIDKLEGIKESHKRCAETYKASYVSCGTDYTAYIYNEGKSMCVYCYHCNEAND